MKKTMLFFLLLIGTMSLFSQTDVPVTSDLGDKYSQQIPNYEYCQIVGTSNLLGTKVTIVIDFGQERKWAADLRLKGDDGKAIKFNSMVDAMNFMGNQGWEFIQAYAITVGNANVYHFLLKKEIKD